MPKIRRQVATTAPVDKAAAPAPVQAVKGSDVTIARAPRPAAGPTSTVPTAAAPTSIVSTPLEGVTLKTAAERVAALQVIQAEVKPCERCHELASTRTQTVFGVGNPMAQICFVGEAPGADEDERGEPFVGRAGQLLTKIIEACQLKREDVFILNVLKCRPPGNRPPLPTEVHNCRPFLDRQLAVIRPQYICCLGTTAAQTLLQTERTIGQLRGQFHDYRGIPVLCTYHPAYLLRNPSAKREVWDDMKKLMAKLGVVL
jgi:DNA polymerase